ncbi:serine/threonine-protein phosphatase [Salmonella enterica subsp. diarizonae]|nr:serine/threonine-protein phosphatase [Salmonella enterica subsp. diarizonae]EAS4985177.1 serine/threonine-protein phosphatase [Salmonella enterica]EBT9640690.1 serine/threonine-protein phosphatase [Salmonella enterica]ECC1576857.1 serine/threonine-protein phosphatase [Salmonella enterica subsp. diarizonae]ECE6215526.1 serine/threonine-protein phosphatase [Salmonella enterica subsp. diarizonae]
MHCNMAAFSHQGRKKENQDSYLSIRLDNGAYLLAIADGVGGHEGGLLASSAAIREVSRLFSKDNEVNINYVFSMVKAAIIREAKAKEAPKMATTLTICYINNNMVSVGHVGDCRLYHLRDTGIITKTIDQSERQKLIDTGVLTKERARFYHRRNVLLSVLSSDTDFDLFETTFHLQLDDRLLLVSDGVYSLCSKKELVAMSSLHNDINKWLDSIVSLIQSKEVKDDYTGIGFEMKC